MRVAFWSALLALEMIGCAAPNSMDRVIDKLSNENALMFKGGLFSWIPMPSDAPPTKVAEQALKNDDRFAATNCTAVRVRQVRISRGEEAHSEWYPGFDPNYSAVLFQTALGERIVILQFVRVESPHDRPGFWWSRVYDPKQLFNDPPGANSRPGIRSKSESLRRAAIAQAGR